MSHQLDISTPEKEGVIQVSKARKLPVLIDLEELEGLFSYLGDFEIYDVSRPVTLETTQILRAQFLKIYGEYIEGIKEGKLVDEGPLRPFFSAIFTLTSKVLYAQPLSNGKYLVKVRKPVIQVQRHHFIFSQGFHSGIISDESITWGLQFSYPQLYLDPKTQAIGKVEKNESFPNTELFLKLAKWVRDFTSATPFLHEGKLSNQPIRLGKKCFAWINNHPKLKEKRLYVGRTADTPISH